VPPRIILFYPDTGAEHPLWGGSEDPGLYDLDDLPLDADLRERLERWSDEASWPEDYLDKPDRIDALRREGHRLATEVQLNLGSSYEVRWAWDA
jgi:hypothetical protein